MLGTCWIFTCKQCRTCSFANLRLTTRILYAPDLHTTIIMGPEAKISEMMMFLTIPFYLPSKNSTNREKVHRLADTFKIEIRKWT